MKLSFSLVLVFLYLSLSLFFCFLDGSLVINFAKLMLET